MNYRIFCAALLACLSMVATAAAQNPPSKDELEALEQEKQILQKKMAAETAKAPPATNPGAAPGTQVSGQGDVFTSIKALFSKPARNTNAAAAALRSPGTNAPGAAVGGSPEATPDANPPVLVITELSKSKQQQLAELLEEYRREKIGPVEYHQKRRQTLTGP